MTVVARPRWASRAGDKLEAALDAFGVGSGRADVPGRRRLDRRLHRRPARRGRGTRLRRRRRSWPAARPPARATRAWSAWSAPTCARWTRLPEPIDLATLDLSFISLRLVLPAVRGLLARGARWSRWSSPSSRPAGRPCRAAASSAIRPPIAAVLLAVRRRTRPPPASACAADRARRSPARMAT